MVIFLRGKNALITDDIITRNELVRQYHYQLVNEYLHDTNNYMKNHANDIIKQEITTWNSLDANDVMFGENIKRAKQLCPIQ